MYCQHFGFREKPFDVTPNPKFIFASQAHREALASLVYGIRERRGFIVLIGEVGTGKTLLLNTVIDRIGNEVKAAYVYNTKASFDQFMTLALVDFGIAESTAPLSQVDIIHRLNQFAIEQLANNGNVVLIIDEAQNLLPEDLEKIRLLSNLETRQRKLVQIVLSGQPELEAKLSAHELRQLAQRINVKRHILPLDAIQTVEYVHHRLSIAGYAGPELFTKRALDMLVNHSGGIPRMINMVCDNALLIAFGLGKKKIDEAILEEAVSDLTWNPAPGGQFRNSQSADPAYFVTPKTPSPRRWVFSLFIGVLLFGLGMAGGYVQFGKNWESGPDLKDLESAPVPQTNKTLQTTAKSPPSHPAKVPNLEGAVNRKVENNSAPHRLNESESVATDSPKPAVSEADANGAGTRPELPSRAPSPGPTDISSQALPKEIGEITVSSGENLSMLVRRVYGESDSLRVRNVMSFNPEVADPNVVEIGDTIRFPATPIQTDISKERPRYWVVLSKFDSLDKGHAFLRKHLMAGLPVRMITRWQGKMGFEFLVVLKTYAENNEEAMKLLKSLPPGIGPDAGIAQLPDTHWVYYSNPLLLSNKPQPQNPG